MKTEFKRQASCQSLFFFLFLIVMAFVPCIEFINTSGSINKFHLARIEWMRGIGYLRLISGYSFPSSRVTVSLEEAVERVRMYDHSTCP